MVGQLAVLTLVGSLICEWYVPTPAYNFLETPVTPRTIALGGCGVALVGPGAAFYNPAAPGLLHLDKKCSVSLPFHDTPFMAVSDQMYGTALAATGGISLRQLRLVGEDSPNLSLAIGYSQLKLDWGVVPGEMVYGAWYYPQKIAESADMYTIALGFERGVRIALGYTSKTAHSDFARIAVGTDVAKCYDIGMVVQTRIRRRLKRPGSPFSSRNVYVNFTPTFAYVYKNGVSSMPPENGVLRYTSDRLIETSNRLGMSVCGSLDRDGRVEILSFTVLAELESIINSESYYDAAAVEFGLGGFFFARAGSKYASGMNDQGTVQLISPVYDYIYASYSLSTYGFGVRISGCLDWLRELKVISWPHGPLGEFLDEFDLDIDYGKAKDNRFKDESLSQSAFKLSFSF